MASPTAAAATTTGVHILALVIASSWLSPATAASFKFNVTEILDEFPEFSVFNGLLSRTGLANEINRRQTVTALVVDDPSSAAVTSLPENTQREALALQILLDYYDPVKLDGVKGKAALLSTLSTTGGGGGGVGLVKYTQGDDDQMAFGSAEAGAAMSSQLVMVVASRPYNLSVMQVSAPVLPPRLGGSPSPSSGNGGSSSSTPSSVSSPASVLASAGENTPAAAAALTTDYDDDDALAPATVDASSATAEGPGNVATTTTSSPSNETSSAADVAADGTKTTSAGSRVVVVGAIVEVMAGLLILLVSV